MSAFTKAVYDVIAGDAQLTGLLATYKGSPAIFSCYPIPEDADLPYIIAEGSISEEPWDTKTSMGREILRDIRCYAKNDGSTVKIENIAERVRDLFHLQKFSISGWACFDCRVSGPVTAPYEEGVIGQILTLNFIAIKE